MKGVETTNNTSEMTGIVSISLQGNKLALRLKSFIPEACCYTLDKWANDQQKAIPGRLSNFCGLLFEEYDAIVFIMATGIVIRSIAPWIKDKTKDPAIVVMDDAGNNVISLLSGHLGGANILTQQIANWLQSHPVITTSSDVNHLPSVDMLAKKYGLLIDSMHDAKVITAMIINKQKVILDDKSCYIGNEFLPEIEGKEEGKIIISNKKEINSDIPFVKLLPQNLHVGIGCKRDTDPDNLWQFLNDVCDQLNIDNRAISSINSIGLKADEPAILKVIDNLNCRSTFFSTEELQKVDFLFEGSAFVKEVTGVASVSTTAAYLAGNQKGKFLIKKKAKDGMTISVFQKELEATK